MCDVCVSVCVCVCVLNAHACECVSMSTSPNESLRARLGRQILHEAPGLESLHSYWAACEPRPGPAPDSAGPEPGPSWLGTAGPSRSTPLRRPRWWRSPCRSGSLGRPCSAWGTGGGDPLRMPASPASQNTTCNPHWGIGREKYRKRERTRKRESARERGRERETFKLQRSMSDLCTTKSHYITFT